MNFKALILFAFFIFSTIVSSAAETKICSKFTTALSALNELPINKCKEIANSDRCQKLYAELAMTIPTEDFMKRTLKCDKPAWRLMMDAAIPLPFKGACTDGVANMVVDMFSSAGTALGEGAAQMSLNAERMESCHKNPEEKKQLVLSTIKTWPKMLKPKSVPAKIMNQDCWGIERWLRETDQLNRRRMEVELTAKMYGTNKDISAEEKEVIEYLHPEKASTNSSEKESILNISKKLMSSLQDKATCYNSDYQIELYCHTLAAAATFVVPGMMALRAARLQKLASAAGAIKEQELAALAEEAIKAGKVRDLASRQELINKVRSLDEPELMQLAEKIYGKTLSQKQKDLILQSHKIEPDILTGKYTPEQLFEKNRLLEEAGIPSETRQVFMRSGLTGKSQQQIIQEMAPGPTKSRLLGDIEGTSASPDVTKMTNHFKEATNYLEKKVGNIQGASTNELRDIEYTASRWGSKASDANEVAKSKSLVGEAGRVRLEKEMAEAAAQSTKAKVPFDRSNYMVEKLNAMRKDLGKGFQREAREFQIKAIIDAFNAKGWNLR